MKKLQFIRLFFLSIFFTACGYFPFVDYYLPADFNPIPYNPTLITLYSQSNNKDIKVFTEGEAWFPTKPRSRKLGFIWSVLNIHLPDSTYKVDFERSKFTLISKVNNELEVEIVGKDVNVIDVKPRSKDIQIEFHYKNEEWDFLKSHELLVELAVQKFNKRKMYRGTIILNIAE